MTPDEYAEYQRCWRTYLDRIHGPSPDLRFGARLTEQIKLIHPKARIWRWPAVWPEVEFLFSTNHSPGSGRANFVAAVRNATGSVAIELPGGLEKAMEASTMQGGGCEDSRSRLVERLRELGAAYSVAASSAAIAMARNPADFVAERDAAREEAGRLRALLRRL